MTYNGQNLHFHNQLITSTTPTVWHNSFNSFVLNYSCEVTTTHTITKFLSTRWRHDRNHARLDHLYTKRSMMLGNLEELNHFRWEPMLLLNLQVQLQWHLAHQKKTATISLMINLAIAPAINIVWSVSDCVSVSGVLISALLFATLRIPKLQLSKIFHARVDLCYGFSRWWYNCTS